MAHMCSWIVDHDASDAMFRRIRNDIPIARCRVHANFGRQLAEPLLCRDT